jgi:putative transposase
MTRNRPMRHLETYLLTCMRYIELNPVRASMVSHPGEYPWSSDACNASGQHNPLINAHPLYKALGNDAQQRYDTYRELFRRPMDPRQIHAIREALNQKWVLGREDFKDKIERMSKRQVRPGQLRRPRV